MPLTSRMVTLGAPRSGEAGGAGGSDGSSDVPRRGFSIIWKARAMLRRPPEAQASASEGSGSTPSSSSCLTWAAVSVRL